MTTITEKLVTDSLGFRLEVKIEIGDFDFRGRHTTYETPEGQVPDDARHLIQILHGLQGAELAEVVSHEVYHLFDAVGYLITCDDETETSAFGHLVRRIYHLARAQPQPQPSVVDSVMVPRDPTQAMLDAAARIAAFTDVPVSRNFLCATFQAMLAAAPQTPADAPEATTTGEHATMAPSREMAELALAALGHVRKPNDRCTARYAQVPKEQRKPGPASPPIWCYLPLGHEGPHRCNHGGMHPSFPMSDEQRIVHEPLPDTCTKCGVRWPCTEANKVFASLQQPVPSAPDPEG